MTTKRPEWIEKARRNYRQQVRRYMKKHGVDRETAASELLDIEEAGMQGPHECYRD